MKAELENMQDCASGILVDLETIESERVDLLKWISKVADEKGPRFVADATGWPYSALRQYLKPESQRVGAARVAEAAGKLIVALEQIQEKEERLKEWLHKTQ